MRRPADEKVRDMAYGQYLAVFRRAALHLNSGVAPYPGRHSGASLDRSSGLRSLEAVHKRGRWSSIKSVKRCEEAGLMNETWRCLDAATQAYCEARLWLLPDVFRRRPEPSRLRSRRSLSAGCADMQ